jgi:hypothetical protein
LPQVPPSLKTTEKTRKKQQLKKGKLKLQGEKIKNRYRFALLLMLSLIFIAEGIKGGNADKVALTAKVGNAPPTINSLTAYQKNISGADTGMIVFCRNQDWQNIYVRINISDRNGIDEVFNNNGLGIAFVESDENGERAFARFGGSYLYLTPVQHNNIEGSYLYSWIMLKSETNSTGRHYRIKAIASDDNATVEMDKDLILKSEDCFIYEAFVSLSSEPSQIDARITQTAITLYGEGEGMLTVKEQFSPPFAYESFGKESIKYITVSAEPLVTDSIIKFYYTDEELKNLSEQKLMLYYWSGSDWAAVDSQAISEEDNYIWAETGGISQGIFSLFASNGSACIPLWKCTKWSSCRNDRSRRTCQDLHACDTSKDKPKTSVKCDETMPLGAEQPAQQDMPTNVPDANASKQGALFDILVELSEEKISGNQMLAKISLINFGSPANADLIFTITNSMNEVVISQKETVPVETRSEFLRTFDVAALPDGEYTFIADLAYEGQKEPAKSEKTFIIQRKHSPPWVLISAGAFTAALIAVALGLFIKRKGIFH